MKDGEQIEQFSFYEQLCDSEKTRALEIDKELSI